MLVAACLLLAAPARACDPPLTGPDVHRAEGKSFVVAWRADPAPLRLSEFFAVEAAVCAKQATAAANELRVDAVMPEHQHGMNYRPVVKAAGEGRYRAEGFMLHMPGLWEFRFDVRGTSGQEVVRDRLTLR